MTLGTFGTEKTIVGAPGTPGGPRGPGKPPGPRSPCAKGCVPNFLVDLLSYGEAFRSWQSVYTRQTVSTLETATESESSGVVDVCEKDLLEIRLIPDYPVDPAL